MKKYVIAALSALLTAGSVAQTVQQVTIGDNMDYGLTYSLPVTRIEVTVKAHCTKVVAGEFALYAEKYLGLKNVAQPYAFSLKSGRRRSRVSFSSLA